METETRAEPQAAKTSRWLDMSVAFSALFVSVVSLGVAIRMADANARLVSASSWPFLSYGAGWATTAGITKIHMRVINTGVGPAKIESAELIWKGVAFARNQDFLKACCGLEPSGKPNFDSDLVPGVVLRAGERIEFLGFTELANPVAFAALRQAIVSQDLQLNVCYCSIFDECWKSDLTTYSLTPESVKACVQPKVSFDQGALSRKP